MLSFHNKLMYLWFDASQATGRQVVNESSMQLAPRHAVKHALCSSVHFPGTKHLYNETWASANLNCVWVFVVSELCIFASRLAGMIDLVHMTWAYGSLRPQVQIPTTKATLWWGLMQYCWCATPTVSFVGTGSKRKPFFLQTSASTFNLKSAVDISLQPPHCSHKFRPVGQSC